MLFEERHAGNVTEFTSQNQRGYASMYLATIGLGAVRARRGRRDLDFNSIGKRRVNLTVVQSKFLTCPPDRN